MTRRKIVITVFLLLLPVFAYFAFYVYADARLESEIRKLEKLGIHCRPADIAARHHPSPQPVLDEFTRLADAIEKGIKPMVGYPENREAFFTFLDANRELIGQADAFLETHPELTFARDFNSDLGGMLLPELFFCRQWIRFNYLRINRELKQENPEAAARLFDRSVTLRNYTLKEPSAICFLTGISNERIRLQALFDAAESGQIGRFDTATLRRWADSMVPLEKEVQTAFPLSIDTELAVHIEVTQDPTVVFYGIVSPILLDLVSVASKPLIRLDIAQEFDRMPRYREAASLDHLTPDFEILVNDFRDFSYWRYASRMLAPAFLSNLRRVCNEYGRYRTLRTGLAVELFLQKYGKLPDTLEELVPEFLPEIPVSPFSGEPLRYEKGKLERLGGKGEIIEFQGYRIYGGGDPTHHETGRTRSDNAKRLPVWNRTKEPDHDLP